MTPNFVVVVNVLLHMLFGAMTDKRVQNIFLWSEISKDQLKFAAQIYISKFYCLLTFGIEGCYIWHGTVS